MLLTARDRHMLALFELVLLNQPFPGEHLGLLVPRQEYARLIKALRATARAMKAKAVSPKTTARDGFAWHHGLSMVTDEQVAAWQQETQPKTAGSEQARPKKTENPDRIMVRFTDGRIEVFENGPAMERAMARYRAERSQSNGRQKAKEIKSAR